jgi:hypothetical protein
MKRSQLFAVVAVSLLVAVPQAVAAPLTLNFHAITNHNPANAHVGEVQFTCDVAPSSSLVIFTFRNTGSTGSVITDIYFDDGSLLGIATVTNGPGVNFSITANPSELPDAALANPVFQTTQSFSIGANNPELNKGIRPGRYVSVSFTLKSGKTYDDVIRELGTGELRIGVYGQQMGNTNPTNESYVSLVLPEPATIAILGLGLVGLPLMAKRRS